MFLLLWLVKLSNTSGDFLGGGGRQLKYLQFNSLVSSSFNNLTRKDKSRAEGKPHFRWPKGKSSIKGYNTPRLPLSVKNATIKGPPWNQSLVCPFWSAVETWRYMTCSLYICKKKKKKGSLLLVSSDTTHKWRPIIFHFWPQILHTRPLALTASVKINHKALHFITAFWWRFVSRHFDLVNSVCWLTALKNVIEFMILMFKLHVNIVTFHWDSLIRLHFITTSHGFE